MKKKLMDICFNTTEYYLKHSMTVIIFMFEVGTDSELSDSPVDQ